MVDRYSRTSTFRSCFFCVFLILLIFLVCPVYNVISWIYGAYAPAAALIAAVAAVIAAASVSFYDANNYYFCSLIILCDDSDDEAGRICICLENSGYVKTDKVSENITFRSKRFYFVNHKINVEINEGCIVLRGPKRSVSRIAAMFDNCYDWSDKY